MTSNVSRAWWVFLVFGLLAIAFGIAMMVWPAKSLVALAWTFGILCVADGVVSLFSVLRDEVILPKWLLALYGILSIIFGVLLITRPVAMSTMLLLILAIWLIIAGLARILFAIQIRKEVTGEWMLALSGVLAILLGVFFIFRPGVGLLTMVLWIAIVVLIYGFVQIFAAFRLRKLLKA